MNESRLYCPNLDCEGEVVVWWEWCSGSPGDGLGWIHFDGAEPDCECPVDAMYLDELEEAIVDLHWRDE